MTYREIIERAQIDIINRSKGVPDYPIEQHFRDMDLIEELTKLKIKYRDCLDEK